MKRRLAAIMVGDIVGYSAMMEIAEEITAARLDNCQSLISDKVRLLDGRVFGTAGDAALAEFPSPINAVRCAVEIRSGLAGMDGDNSNPMRMRFGVHLADVVVRGRDLVGDGVNVAARIEQSAEPDDILVSGVLFDHVRRNSPFAFDDLGERTFKNMSEPVHIYSVRGEIGGHRLQATPTQPAGIREKRPSSIVVLPFLAPGGDEDQRVLAEGLTEELIVELGRFRRLSVTSRSASFALVGAQLETRRIGEALGVRYVLEGQLRKIADRVRVSMTLSDTETGSVVWSDKILLPFDKLLELLDDTVRKLAATVSGRMDDANMVLARRKRPENMNAFECLLRGIDYHRLGGVTEDNAREAVKWFTRAIEADPNYGVAYAWRTCSASWLSDFDFDKGQRDVCRALELDPHDAEANRIMAAIALLKGNYEEARAHSQRAMELNPSDAYIKARSAGILTYLGEPEKGLTLLDEARDLDPFLPVWCVEERGIALYSLDRFQEALDAFSGLMFQTCRSRLYQAAALIAVGKNEDARKLIREAMAGNATLRLSGFMYHECYRQPDRRQLLCDRLRDAGLAA
jgi:TolB-like protein/class 3 adenylate cyclase/Flp pilus assembly protein TadD